MDNSVKRITYKRVRPNPLFRDWIEELHEESKKKHNKLQPRLKQALESLSRYPLTLESGAECAILKGFNRPLCKFIDQKLKVHKGTGQQISIPSKHQKTKFNSNINLITQLEMVNNGVKRVLSNTTSECHGRPEKEQNVNIVESIDLSLGVGTSTANLNSQYNIVSVESNQSYEFHKADNIDANKWLSPRTGSYAILITLLEHKNEVPSKPYLTKSELISKAQKYCDESFKRCKVDSLQTAWRHMHILEIKGLVLKTNHEKYVYSLTDTGFEVANKILGEKNVVPSINPEGSNVYKNSSRMNINNSEIIPEVIEMQSGSFDVILLIDKRETRGVTKKSERTVELFKKYPSLNHEYRSLNIGDYTWIARHKENKDKELVLPYIVERKRMDDLASSIKDGRYHEQKFRLRKCGLNHVIYLVENCGNNKHVGLPIQTLKQALDNTRIQDKFKVHFTNTLAGSTDFLAMMTKRLTIRYMHKSLRGTNYETNGEDLMTFKFFNKASAKRKALTVTDTFRKMLLKLKGLSVEKVLAITNKYKTPKSLIDAYKKCDEKEGRLLLAYLKHDRSKRNVGPCVSNKIYSLFSGINFI